MNRMSRLTIVIIMLGLTILATACAKPPQADIDTAKQDLARAEAAHAAEYAPEALVKAKESNRVALAEVDAQASKLALVRSYKHAAELLATAKTDAVAAQNAAAAAKAEAQERGQAALDAATSGLSRADELLAKLGQCPRRPKGFAKDLELMRGTVDGLRQQLTTVGRTMSEQKYLAAIPLAEGLKAEVGKVVSDIEGAAAKLGC
jgi:hypothetical protein